MLQQRSLRCRRPWRAGCPRPFDTMMERGDDRSHKLIHLQRFTREPPAAVRHKARSLALAQVDGLVARSLPARVALHAWTGAEMAREIRAGQRDITSSCLNPLGTRALATLHATK